MTIWVIEYGDYSDYRVAGVFSTRENAQAAAKAFGYGEDCISEWPLDPWVGELNQGRRLFRVRMLRDGTSWTEECKHTPMYDGAQTPWRMGPYAERTEFRNALTLMQDVWATDEQHAVKIVNERRLMLIANNEWRSKSEVLVTRQD